MQSNASVELLAPAGGPEALRAAVRAGANAVYLGLDSFNARRSAENFTLETLADACDWAHLRGVRVYVALNTVVFPGEVSEVLECARQAYRAGADAFIVQDIGIASELTRTLPDARMHASTQMNTHNLAGIEAAARLGAARVTLARELSLPEIAHLADAAARLGMEVETFVHGALCVCYSGQCLMSSMIGGRSANRGTCAQACRLPYTLKNRATGRALPADGEHLLSPKDLAAIDLLPDLVHAGVASLKIEGRMKSADYVYAVTSAYRSTLDRIAAGADARPTAAERQSLAEAFSRGFTTAYLTSERGNGIMSYGRPNNRGIAAGRIARIDDGVAVVEATIRFSEGDVIEIWTGKGRTSHVLSRFSVDKEGRIRVPLDVRSRADRAVRAGDRVFRVRSAEAAFADDEREPRVAVEGSVTLRIGRPAEVTFWVSDPETGEPAAFGRAEGDVVERARTKAVNADEVRDHVDRLGQTPFALAAVHIDLDEGVGIGFSQIHRLRTAALEDLAGTLLAPYRDRQLPRVEVRQRMPRVETPGCAVVALATNPACARAAKRAGADEVIVPALYFKRGESVIAGQRSDTAEQSGYPKQCFVALPAVDHDPVEGSREAAVGFDAWEYVSPGKRVLADSLGALVRAAEEGAVVDAGSHLPLTNKLALDTAARLGAQRAWLSPELTLRQIEELARDGAPLALGIFLIGAQELMVTEHCMLMSQGPCNEDCSRCARRKSPHYLEDRKGFEFPVITDQLGRSHLYNSVPLDVAHAVPELLAAGISALLVDTTLMNKEEAAQAVGRAVRARNVAQSDGNAISKNSNATSGHLFRAVQ